MMKTNPHLQDEIYRIVGEEVARKEYHPGPMARAVAEARGNRDMVQSLYIKFRYEELGRQIERAAREKDYLTCPKCGHYAKPELKSRGSVLLVLLLLCAFIVPGILYALIFSGYKAVCANCGNVLLKRV